MSMNLQQIYSGQPQAAALHKTLADAAIRRIFLQGLVASAAPVFFSGMAQRRPQTTLFVLQDADEAGYFYQDLVQLMGQNDVLFFPSSYRRAVKYGQRDAANEISRRRPCSAPSPETSGRLWASACPRHVPPVPSDHRPSARRRFLPLTIAQDWNMRSC